MYSHNDTESLEKMKSSLRIEEDHYKYVNRLNLRMSFEQQKNLASERERELKKSQTEIVTINEQGRVEVQTQNLRINTAPRIVANFYFPEIIIFQRLKNPCQEIFLFLASYNNTEKYVFLDPKKCGSGTYLLKRLLKIGFDVQGQTLAIRKTYAIKLFSILILQAKEIFTVPERREWYVKEEKIQFFKGKWTWEELSECLKL